MTSEPNTRGYIINAKLLALSFLIEGVVVVSGACVGISLASRYAASPAYAPFDVALLDGWITLPPLENHGWWLAIIATLMICVAELARVPLAVVSRTHRSAFMRIVLLVGVVMMILVTGKTVSQALEQQFHGRLVEVQQATGELKLAESHLDLVERQRTGRVTIADPKIADVAAIDVKITETQKSLQVMGAKPKPVCIKVSHRNPKTGQRWTTPQCSTSKWPGDALLAQLDVLQTERSAAAGNRDVSVQASAELETAIASAKIAVSDAADKQRKAISDSQLHSFTAMIYGVDPVDVTERQLHWFLRFFVLFPAGMIACASTLLALGSVTRLPQTRKVDVNNPIIAKFLTDTVDNHLAAKEARSS
jgi:hypothetical protein